MEKVRGRQNVIERILNRRGKEEAVSKKLEAKT